MHTRTAMESALATAADAIEFHSYAAPYALERHGAADEPRTERASTPAELARAWRDLFAGHAMVVRADSRGAWTYLELTTLVPERALQRPQGAILKALEQILLGEPMKAVALELGVSRSILTTQVAKTLSFLGFTGGANQVPPIAAVLALSSQSIHLHSGSEPGENSVFSYRVTVPRPRVVLGPELSPAEASVIELISDGASYDESARLRQTSTRTVANQIANAYRKLGVSGRLELLADFARRVLSSSTPLPPARETHTRSALSAMGSCALPVI